MITTLPPAAQTPTSQTQQEGWEVVQPDGSVYYRGDDLTLAAELYHLLPHDVHLRPAGGGSVAR